VIERLFYGCVIEDFVEHGVQMQKGRGGTLPPGPPSLL